MKFQKCMYSGVSPSHSKALSFSNKMHPKAHREERNTDHAVETDVDIDIREVYFLIMHFLSSGPCQRTFGHLLKELLEHQLLPRRYHAWFSRTGTHSGTENDDGISFPLSYDKLVERHPHIEKDHLVTLLKQMILSTASPVHDTIGKNALSAADVPTLLGTGSFSLLDSDRNMENKQAKSLPVHLRWPHMLADQVRGLSLREIGGGFSKHHRAPSIRSACYAIAKPSTMVRRMENKKQLRGHRDAVYCAIFDHSGRYVITGSDDRLVKIWSLETAFCLASCRGHEGDITDLAVSANNCVVASAANDFVIRVWRLPDGYPISVLRGHTGVVTAIAFSPKLGSTYNLLSSSDDGTCRIWDARTSLGTARVYLPKPLDAVAGRSNSSSNGPSSSSGPLSNQILCCAYNASGTVFVTGSSDTYARVWNACRSNTDDLGRPIHEMDVLSGHENDVNYVQFSGCAVASRSQGFDTLKEENIPKFKNSWFCHDNIVTCSRDGSAIIWVSRSRRSHGKAGRWTRAYHLKVPPPPLPPQPPRGGPRQRLLPTPRGVNMIVWSLDNRFVLAAIMDCRICVWNAGDGSLVHSLTGHSASSYVLDVHPFNPRIAMSAGYDGKTIVWDIWEGTPIQIYEVGPFKLVDGKFSPDGTSIVLSDDMGQIYFLNTGQGESQKDAKYDQFFLGDYRPLTRDTQGHVLDQETQLSSYHRNIQDPLCDSNMVPYTEPYQSMYQRRRLGALGMEWNPTSTKFAIGPDINVGQDYQMPPLADLQRMIEPLPEFTDAMYWEPEIDVPSEDTDSEYDVTEEFYIDGEQRNVSPSFSSDPECSSEDSEVEPNHKDGFNRLRRKKHIVEVEVMTSSGRRGKKRNLGKREDTISGSNKKKKTKSGRKTSNSKYSKAKMLRPQRIAARNALNTFTQISGSTDGEDEDDSEDYLSESESEPQDSNIRSNGSARNLQLTCKKDPQPSLAAKPPEFPESQPNVGSRKKLILKISIRDSKKCVPSEHTEPINDNQTALSHVSSQPQEITEENRIYVHSQDTVSSSADMIAMEWSDTHKVNNMIDRKQSEKAEDNLEASEGDGINIRREEVQLRTSKRLKAEDIMLANKSNGLDASSSVSKDKVNDANVKLERTDALQDPDWVINGGHYTLDDANKSLLLESSAMGVDQLDYEVSAVSSNENLKNGRKDLPDPNNNKEYNSIEIAEVAGTNHSHELKGKLPPKFTKIKFRMKGPTKLATAVDDKKDAGGDLKLQSSSWAEQNMFSGVMEGEDAARSSSRRLLHSDSCSRLSEDVHEMEKPYKIIKYSDDVDVVREENNSNEDDSDQGIGFSEAATDVVHRTRSMKLKAATREPHVSDSNCRARRRRDSVESLKIAGNFSTRAGNEFVGEESMSYPKMTVRSRYARNRDGEYKEPSSYAGRKSSYPAKKISWLMLSDHEESYRYIPQLGDEVVYLRQGHQEFIESSGSLDTVPWRSIGGNISAVEVCKVSNLDYATLSGSGEGCCKLKLIFVDPSSSVFGKAFKLTLPELINFPDFIVEKTWYDASIRRNWTNRDKCLVWWRNEIGEGGNWWEGRILSSQPKSPEFPESPWERNVIRYKTDPANDHLHSPWELHDPDIPWEHPHLDFGTRDQLLSAFAKLEHSASRNKDRHGFQMLNDVSQKLNFLNRFPVPLYPEVIRLRLENNYYRSLEAVKHDITVMISNAESYFARNNEQSNKVRRLSDYFTETVSRFH